MDYRALLEAQIRRLEDLEGVQDQTMRCGVINVMHGRNKAVLKGDMTVTECRRGKDRPAMRPEGAYVTDWKPTKAEDSDYRCIKCGSDEVEYREWESTDGAFEDFHYRCKVCGREWWAEGADA